MDTHNFVEWLEEKLQKRGWKPSDLAQRAGVYPATVNRVLNRERQPGVDLCRGIAKALGEPEEKVFRKAGLLSPLPGPEDDLTLRECIELMKALPPEERRLIREYAEFRYKAQQSRATNS